MNENVLIDGEWVQRNLLVSRFHSRDSAHAFSSTSNRKSAERGFVGTASDTVALELTRRLPARIVVSQFWSGHYRHSSFFSKPAVLLPFHEVMMRARDSSGGEKSKSHYIDWEPNSLSLSNCVWQPSNVIDACFERYFFASEVFSLVEPRFAG